MASIIPSLSNNVKHLEEGGKKKGDRLTTCGPPVPDQISKISKSESERPEISESPLLPVS